MSIAIITGSAGLIGSEAAGQLHEQGLDIIGVDNDMRRYFFGDEGSTEWNAARLCSGLSRYRHVKADVRDREAIMRLFGDFGKDIKLVIHAAGQPSHDWAAREPFTDFEVNATGTMVLLEATRQHCPDAAFIFTSTNKVYGDTPNQLPLRELTTRWELDPAHPYAEFGVDETMSIDQSKHSLFGVSKTAGDLMVQEYGRYFGMKTAVFRCGCLTGPAHSGAALHGFLAYLVKCAVSGTPYTIHGYKGKQVRDNIHARDLADAFWNFFHAPRIGAVYNMGGGRHSNCSMLEAICMIQELCGRELNYEISDTPRSGDHIWWISDVRRFASDYPEWIYQYDIRRIIAEMVEAAQARERHSG